MRGHGVLKSIVKIWLSLMAFSLLGAGPLLAEGGSDPEPEALTLDAAWRLAVETNESLAIQKEQVYIAENLKLKAYSLLLPNVSADAAWTSINSEASSTFVTSSGEDQEEGQFTTINVKDYYVTKSWGAQVVQPLLNGQALPLLYQAYATIDAQHATENRTLDATRLEVARAYLGVLSAEGNMHAASEQVERLEKHRQLAKTLVEVGRAIKTDLLQAEVELQSAQTLLRQARNGVDLAWEAFYLALGRRGSFKLEKPEEVLESMLVPLEEGLDTARRERGDARAAVHGIEAAKQKKNQSYSQFLPVINFIGRYGHEESDAVFGRESDVWSATFSANLPIFEGGMRFANLREDYASIRASELAAQRTQRAIGLEVRQAYLNMQTARDVVESTRLESELARERFDLVEERFRQGAATSLDVKDAQTVLTASEVRRINAEYGLLEAQLGYLHSVGVLHKLESGSARRDTIQE